jgi:hypothetical protein
MALQWQEPGYVFFSVDMIYEELGVIEAYNEQERRGD